MSDIAPTPTVIFSVTARPGYSIGAALLLYAYLFTNLGWRQASLFWSVWQPASFSITQLSALPPRGEVALTGRSAGLRAHDYARHYVLIFTPLIAQGEIFGIAVRGSVAP